MRKEALRKREIEAKQKAEAAARKQSRAITKTIVEEINIAIQNNQIIKKVEPFNPFGKVIFCANNCTAERRVSNGDDKWRGCPVIGCENWYCSKKLCHVNALEKHMKACEYQRRVMQSRS